MSALTDEPFEVEERASLCPADFPDGKHLMIRVPTSKYQERSVCARQSCEYEVHTPKGSE